MHATFSAKKEHERIENLNAEVASLAKELGDGVDADRIVKRHISLLHDYNEAKDATQVLIGKLAQMKGVTIRQIHEDLGLPLTD